jgi:hypothetical protein
MSYTSLCVLSFERVGFLQACLESIREAGASYELIVHDDGSEDPAVLELLTRLYREGLVSQLLLNAPGQNEGVGAAVRKCFAAAHGDVLAKIDQDLVFPSRDLCNEGWLAQLRLAFEDPAVGCAGAFAYHHDPVDVEKTRILGRIPPEGSQHFYVQDFVGSLFVVPRAVYERPDVGPIDTHSSAFAEDVELKKRIQAAGFELSLPDEDLCANIGFGVGPSTVVVAENTVREIHRRPLIFDGQKAERP